MLAHNLVKAIVPKAHPGRPATLRCATADDANRPLVGEGEPERAGHEGDLRCMGVGIVIGIGAGVEESCTLVDIEAGVLA